MNFDLKPHPDFPFAAVTGVSVTATRPAPTTLHMHFVVKGDTAAMLLPPVGELVREDELWKHTCLEAFVMPAGKPVYFEINVAPSGGWAVYQFDSYREGMKNPVIGAPRVTTSIHPNKYEMTFAVDLPNTDTWRLNLPAVIEEKDGKKSFWALAHNPGKPDFHHTDVFLCTLERP